MSSFYLTRRTQAVCRRSEGVRKCGGSIPQVELFFLKSGVVLGRTFNYSSLRNAYNALVVNPIILYSSL